MMHTTFFDLLTRGIWLLILFWGLVSCQSQDHVTDQEALQVRREVKSLASWSPELKQYPNIDSAQHYLLGLLEQIKPLKDNYLETVVLYKLGCNYAYHMDLRKSDSCFLRLIELTPSPNDSTKVAHAYVNLGSNDLRRGNFEGAIAHFTKADDIAKDSGLESEISALIWTNMGMAYSSLEQHAQAMDYLDKALASVRLHKNNERLEGVILQAMGNSFFVQNDLENAYRLFTMADSVHIYHDQEKEALAARCNRAAVMQDMHKYSEALELNQECERLAKEVGYTHLLGILYTNRGRIYLAQGAYGEAGKILDEAQKMRREDLAGLAQVYSSQMDLALALADVDLAQKYGRKALELAQQMDNKLLQMDIWASLADISTKAGRYKEANEALLQQMSLKDSLFTQEKYRALQDIAVKYETEQKDADLKQAYLDLEISRLHRTILVLLLSALVLVGIFAFWLRRRTMRQYRALANANRRLAAMINRSLEPVPSNAVQPFVGEPSHAEGTPQDASFVSADTQSKLENTDARTRGEATAQENREYRQANTEELLVRLKKCMEEQKIYLNPDLTLDMLAQEVSTNRTYLSQVINHRIGKGFTDYINFYRIEEAKVRLAMSNDKISVIAAESGFGCSQTFYTAFKRCEQMSPNAYRKALKDVSLDSLG